MAMARACNHLKNLEHIKYVNCKIVKYLNDVEQLKDVEYLSFSYCTLALHSKEFFSFVF